ncbi:glycoside hydrolase family 19 protein [Rhodococcoides kyotonense]|uniref:Putative chitinase n=1 Tax=Rhodococcoides kyotonense TaxID=398843 RepID=A0A239GZY3_9NOCA|nr:glycoside hydrolase family 19 protein [Rhodococcus kyotonensis]SNS74103.1 putative chitinase [Rhodococcus kyotonensis]
MHVSTYARRIGFAAATTSVLATSVVGVTHADHAVTVPVVSASAITETAAKGFPAGSVRQEVPAAANASDPVQQPEEAQPSQTEDVTAQTVSTDDGAAEVQAAAAVPPPPPTFITAAQLAAIVPQVPADKLATYVAPLNAAMVSGGIDNPIRKAAFIAQLLVESDGFRTFEEYASGRAYEGRSDLGNTQPGDGQRYKGRGAIQVTGRHNYESMSQATGVDFVSNPELVSSPEYAFTTAVWYWTSRHLNQAADISGIIKVSELVNGGHHGLAERLAAFQRGLDAFTRL